MDHLSEASTCLVEYISHVETAVCRSISIEPFPVASPEDQIKAVLNIGPSFPEINIQFKPLRPVSDLSIEIALAHELTHALQIYSLGYPVVDAPDDVLLEDVQKAADIMDFIDDIAVDALIQRRGFEPTTQDHLVPFEHNCKVLELAKNRSSIDPFNDDPLSVEIKFVGDYLYAWALLKFAELDEETIRLFNRFTRRFPQVLKAEFKKAKQIKKLFSIHDIFDKSGRTAIVEGSISLWPLDERIFMVPLDAG
jgi:hypothetical protein